jgi:polar amino acid transport system substrate-binding protein
MFGLRNPLDKREGGEAGNNSFLLWMGMLLVSSLWLTACTPESKPPILTKTLPEPTNIPENTIRLANGYWPPYNGANLPHGGCDSWVIEEAFALQGIKVEYGYFPWVRSLSLSKNGDWDGTLAWDDTPELRKQYLTSAEPTTVQEWVFFYRKDQPLVWQSLDDLAGKRVGLTTGYVYSDSFEGLKQKGTVTFIESSSDEANFEMLLAGRIDAFAVERNVGHYLINKLFTEEDQALLMDSSTSFSDFDTYLLLSRAIPQNKERMELFDLGMKQLRESGRYAEIMQECNPEG